MQGDKERGEMNNTKTKGKERENRKSDKQQRMRGLYAGWLL
jgi:hypothetical protein